MKESDGLRFNCGRQTRLVVRSKSLVSICGGSFRKGAETGQETRFAFFYVLCVWLQAQKCFLILYVRSLS